MRRWLRRDTAWVPTVPPRQRFWIVLLLFATPFVAGVDFLMGENADSLSIVERSMPAPAWGALLLCAGAAMVVGYADRRPKLCIGGLHLAGALFLTIAAGIGWNTVDAHGSFRGPWIYALVGACLWIKAVGYAQQIRQVPR